MAISELKTMGWKLVGSATGTTPISLPTDWSELLIYAVDMSYLQSYSFNVTRDVLDIVSTRPFVGGGYSSSAQYWMTVKCSETSVSLSSALANGGTDRKSNVQVRVYYK